MDTVLIEMLTWKHKSKDWKRGLLQGYLSCNAVTHSEWQELSGQYCHTEKQVPPGWSRIEVTHGEDRSED